MGVSRPAKISNVIAEIKRCLESGHFLDTRHSRERQYERQIIRPEIIFALRHGYHEKKKDRLEKNF